MIHLCERIIMYYVIMNFRKCIIIVPCKFNLNYVRGRIKHMVDHNLHNIIGLLNSS